MFDENSSLQRKEAFPVKRISRERSRRNIVCRRRSEAARHKQSGHWTAQERPMFSSRRVHYEVSASTDAMSFGGISAIHRLVSKLGLPEELNEWLPLLKVHLPYHESDHVLNLAYNVLCGGTRLEDIERLRHDTAYMNALGADLIPDPTTAGDFCRRFQTEAPVIALTEAINAVRPKLWQGRGRDLLQGHLGLCAFDHLLGQHEGSALSGQPSGQHAWPHRCGYVDRQGH